MIQIREIIFLLGSSIATRQFQIQNMVNTLHSYNLGDMKRTKQLMLSQQWNRYNASDQDDSSVGLG
jgi:hypothetical protein